MASSAETNVVVELEARIEKFMSDMAKAGEAVNESMRRASEAVGKHTDDIKQKLEGASEGARESGEKLGTNFGEGLKLIAAAVGTEFLLSIKENVEKAAEYAENLGKLSIETGDSAKKLQELQFAFAAVGVSSERAGVEFQAFQRRLQQAAQNPSGNDIFTRIGLDPKKMATGSVTENIDLVATKFSQLKTSAEKTEVATSLFGRSGYALLPILEQGSAGIEKLKQRAEQMGGVLDEDVREKLERFKSTITQFAITSKVFYAEFAAPFVEGVTKVIEAIEQLAAKFEDLDNATKTNVIFAAVAASFITFESAINLAKRAFVGLIPSEIYEGIGFLQSALVPLAAAAVAFYSAYQTNFGGFKTLVQDVVGTAQFVFGELNDTVKEVANSFTLYIKPALDDLSKAFRPVIDQLDDTVKAFKDDGPWQTFRDIINDVVKAIGKFIDSLKNLVPYINTLHDAVIALTAASVFPAFLALLIEVKAQLAFAALYIETLATVAIPAFTAALSEGIVPALKAFIAVLYGTAAAEDIASLGVTLLIQALVALITFVAIQLVTNWKGSMDNLQRAWKAVQEVIVGGTADLVESFGNMVRGIGEAFEELAGWLPFVKGLADGLVDAADRITRAADRMHTAAAKIKKDREDIGKVKHDSTEADFRDRPVAPYEPPKKEPEKHGSVDLSAKTKKTSAGEFAREDIEKIKNQLKPLEESLSYNELAAKKLGTELKALGTIDTPAKFARSQSIAVAETINLSQKLQDQTRLLAGQQNVVRELEASRARMHDPKIVREYTNAIEQQKKAEIATQGQMSATQGEIYAKQFDYEKKAIEFAKQQADLNEATTNSFAGRIVAAQKYLAYLKEMNAPLKDQNEAITKLVSLQKESYDFTLRTAKNLDDSKLADVENKKKLRDAQVIDPTNILADRQRKLADASDDVTTAIINLTKAKQDEQAATNLLIETRKREGAGSVDAQRALADLNAATIARTRTEGALAEVQQRELNLQQETSKAVDDVRSGLLGLAQRTVPEVVAVLKSIKDGVNPLQAIFLGLFEKSQAFELIQKTMTVIMTRLAQVFDALRPVIEILLGALVGVVNIFLGFYNVLATILNLFGLHIQKIKLVNDQLDTLGQVAKPLIQITHDLPTINEYNSGKIADLKQQVDQNSINASTDAINAGFDHQLSKLGEILGTLFAIKTIVALLGGKSLNSQVGGIGSFLSGLFGKKNGSGGSGVGGGGGPDVTNPGDLTNGVGGDGGWGDGGSALTDATTAQTTSTTDNTDAQNTQTPVIQSGTDATTTNTDATNSLTSAISSYIPALLSLFSSGSGGSGGSGGGGLAGIFSAGASLFETVFGKTGQSVGSQMTANFVDAGMSIFKGLSKGGSFQETLSGAGEAVGTIFGGPVGGAIGKVAGDIIGSLFGPHLSAYKNPDIEDTQNYGQDNANLLGSAGTNGQSFTQNAELAKLFQGKTGIAEVETMLAKYGSAANAPSWLAPMFDKLKGIFGISATGSGQLQFGHNIGDQHITGADGTDGQIHRYNDIAAALEDFTKGLVTATDATTAAANAAAQNLGDILKSSTSLDLANLFGNGQVSAISGGYTVNHGTQPSSGMTPAQAVASAGGTPPQINVTIGAIHGTDPAYMKQTMSEIMYDVQTEWARRELAARRTLSFVDQTGFN